jgi:hypothetical protein
VPATTWTVKPDDDPDNPGHGRVFGTITVYRVVRNWPAKPSDFEVDAVRRPAFQGESDTRLNSMSTLDDREAAFDLARVQATYKKNRGRPLGVTRLDLTLRRGGDIILCWTDREGNHFDLYGPTMTLLGLAQPIGTV